MFKHLKYRAAILVALALTGCSSTTTKVVVETKYVAVGVPTQLFEPIKVTAPPKREVYLAGKCEVQRSLLTEYTIHLLTDLKIYEDRLQKIEATQADQLKIMEKTE
jgi:uncharacterized protein YcfL